MSEVDQINSVHGMLALVGICPSPLLEVLLASGKKIFGQLLRDQAGNTQTSNGWAAYGSILLATDRGKAEVDYLDIVTVRKAPARDGLAGPPFRLKRRSRPRQASA